MKMSCESAKWECLYCTYRNWPSALKCTMCRAPKPLQVIEEGAPPVLSSLSSMLEDDSCFGATTISQFSSKLKRSSPVQIPICSSTDKSAMQPTTIFQNTKSEDIVKPKLTPESPQTLPSQLVQSFEKSGEVNYSSDLNMAAFSSSADSQGAGIEYITAECNEDSKWSCSACTFFNWPRAERCAQCNTDKSIKPELRDEHRKSAENSDMKLLTISDFAQSLSLSPAGDTASAAAVLQYPVKIKSTNQVTNWSSEGAEKCISSCNSPKNSNVNDDKWTCLVCTYDNWPRATKCIMCMSLKGEKDSVMDMVSLESEKYQQENRSSVSQNCRRDIPNGLVPSMGNLSLEIANNRGASFENSSFGVDENSVNQSYTDTIRMRMFRNREMDGRWLDACRGVVDGKIGPVEEYLAAGGDPARQLTQAEALILNRPSAFDAGFTLVHLALRFHQENVLATLLSQVDGGPSVVKRVPSYAAPDIALDIRRQMMASIRQRKGSFHCYFTSELVTFTLPSEIDDLPAEIQETLFNEILDRDVQKELENGQIINWSVELTEQLNSRLYALWNRSAGDCLLDSVLQATWGIFDKDNGLRRALSDSLHDCATLFYQRWKENELFNARLLNFSLNEAQCTADWAKLLSLASQPGSSLEQLHIFALAHILRRPIIVYGVKYVKSFRGETLGYARYEGVYLPFLWEPTFCWKSPITLGYTRGHFSALIPINPDCDPMARVASAAQLDADDINARSTYLPLNSVDGTILPIHFLTQSEIGKEELIMSQWLDVSYTDAGIMIARQRIQKRPLLVAQMVEEWLNHYRRLGQMTTAPYMRQPAAACYSSDGDSEND